MLRCSELLLFKPLCKPHKRSLQLAALLAFHIVFLAPKRHQVVTRASNPSLCYCHPLPLLPKRWIRERNAANDPSEHAVELACLLRLGPLSSIGAPSMTNLSSDAAFEAYDVLVVMHTAEQLVDHRMRTSAVMLRASEDSVMVVMPGRGTDQAPPLPSLEQSFGPFAPLCLVASRFLPPSVGKATLLL